MEQNAASPKEPDQKGHDKALKDIKGQIKSKEAKMKSVSYKAPERDKYIVERNKLCSGLTDLTGKMEERKKSKQEADASLLAVNKEIQSKSENITKLQAKLPYKSKQKADAVIGRLQVQLGQRDLKLREEKQLVAEIDALNSCKKNIEEYHIRKAELDEMRVSQKAFRADREIQSKEITTLKTEEHRIKKCLGRLREEEDLEWKEYRAKFGEQEQLGRSINELYKQKRELVSRFQLQKQAWLEYIEKKTVVKTPSRKEDRSVKSRRMVERKDSLEKSVLLCDALIGYLHRLMPAIPVDKLQPADDVQPSKPLLRASTGAAGPVGEYLLTKDDDPSKSSDLCFGVTRKPSKRQKRGRKQTTSSDSSKKLLHNSAVFSQFLQLDVEPPLTTAAVPECLQRIGSKKIQFEALKECEKKTQNAMQHCPCEPKSKLYSTETGLEEAAHDDASPQQQQHVDIDEDPPISLVVKQSDLLSPQDELPSSVSSHGIEEHDEVATHCDVQLKQDPYAPTSAVTQGTDDADSFDDDTYSASGIMKNGIRDQVMEQQFSELMDSKCNPVSVCNDSWNTSNGDPHRSSLGTRSHDEKMFTPQHVIGQCGFVARRCRSLDSFHATATPPRNFEHLISNSLCGGSQQDVRRLDAIAVQSEIR